MTRPQAACGPVLPLLKKGVQFNHSIRRLALWLTALSLIVIGTKLWLIQGYGTPVPYYDQWREADGFFKPWLEGRLTPGAWFAPHNEHRIFLTRLLDLVCLKLNGQWDPLLQLVVNAFIHTAFICGLVYGLWVFGGRKDQGLFCLLLIPFFALPVAAENTLWGFQSQVYFLIIFAVAAVAGLGFHRPGSKGWLLGFAAAVLSLFTMASGFLVALAVAGLLGLRRLTRGQLNRDSWFTLGSCFVVSVAGAALTAKAGLHPAPSGGAMLASLAWILAWPFEHKPAMLLFTCAPLALTAIKYAKGEFKDARVAEFLLTLGFWGFLQSAALAYARTDQVNCSRYADLFCVLPIAGLASLFILGEGESFQRISRGGLTALATGWVVILLFGVWRTSPRDWQNYDDADNYPLWSAQTRLVQEENIRAFIATGNPAALSHDPEVALLTNTLQDLSRIMPPACRPALPLEKSAGSDTTFVQDGCPPERLKQEFARAWGSYSANGTAATGRFVSQPLTTTLPMLELQLCCAPDAENLNLELVEQASGRRFRVIPQVVSRWHTVRLAAPKSPFHLEITDQSKVSWVAVADLKEAGRFSRCVHGLIHHAVFILLAGLCLLACLAGSDAIRRAPELNSFAAIRWLAFLAVVAAFAGVWTARNFDATKLASDLYANCARNFSRAGQLNEARQFLHEALWLQPDDLKLQNQLRALPEPPPAFSPAGKTAN